MVSSPSVLKRNFQILVASSQVLAIGVTVVQYGTESSLPPELLGYLAAYQTILIADRDAILELLTNIPFVIETLLGLLAAFGLIRFKAWGRSVFVVYVGAVVFITLVTGPHVTTGWTSFVGYLCCLVEGAIASMIYFSPIRRMFIEQTAI